MTSEAQRLIGISLTKIAQARIKTKNGVNLHKNLLVATVLQKARYIFMEEAIQLVQQPKKAPPSLEKLANSTKLNLRKCLMMDNNNNNEANKKLSSSSSSSDKNNDDDDNEEVIYFDLDENRGKLLLEKENKHYNDNNDEIIINNDDDNNEEQKKRTNLKRRRRRSVTESETQEAVQSILPKKLRYCHGNDNDNDDNDNDNNNDKHVIELINRPETNNMDIDRITSLVSIFSLDLCSAQAQTGSSSDNLPNAQYLAMTV